MHKLRTISKFLVALLIPVAQTLQAAYTDDVITQDEWVKIGIAAVLAIGVWRVPNKQQEDLGQG
jgi:hypothetical protein